MISNVLQKNKKAETFKYHLVYFFRFAGDAFFYPLLSMYLEKGARPSLFTNVFDNVKLGFPANTIAYIMMVLPLVSIFVNPIWGFFGRNIRYNRYFLICFSAIEGIFIMFIPFVGVSVPKVIIILIIISVCGQPVYTLLASLAKVYVDINRMEYLTIRVNGTISFALGTLACGFIMNASGQNYALSFQIAGILFVLTSIGMIFIEPLTYEKTYDLNTEEVKPDPRTLFKNENFILVFFFFLLSYGAMISFDTYIANFITGAAGISAGTYGYIQAGFVVVEAAAMLIIVKLSKKKFSLLRYALTFTSLLIVRWTVFALTTNPYLLIIAQFLRGISMAIHLFVYMRMIAENVKIENLTLASIITMSGAGLIRFLFTLGSGKFITDLSNPKSYRLWYIVAIGLAVSSLFFLYMLHLNKKRDALKNAKQES